MKTFFLYALLSLAGFCSAFPGGAQTTPRTIPPLADEVFDPAVNAVGRKIDGRIELLTSEYVLAKALRQALPQVGAVLKIEKHQSEGVDYLVFATESATQPRHRYFIGIRLQTDANGYVFATEHAIVCDGTSACSDCQPVDGCPCNSGGSCNGNSLQQRALGTVNTNLE